MDLTPMVDVTFLLLIFFLITAAFALQKTIAVPPVNDAQSTAVQTLDQMENDSIVVRVDGDNTYWVDCPAWPEGIAAKSRQDMRNFVRAARRGEPPEGGSVSGAGASGPAASKMLVQASGDALHEFVVAALDAGSGAEVEEIRLMSVEDEP
jgi:biopolymer transport protein ExbD